MTDTRQIDDFYPTPPEATQALLDRIEFNKSIWEPACGNGAISSVLIENGHDVTSTDLNDFGFGEFETFIHNCQICVYTFFLDFLYCCNKLVC